MNLKMRCYLRHPTEIPIEILCTDQTRQVESLRNVSQGGLCFRYPQAVAVGSTVRVRIALVAPAFEARGRVTWCLADGDAWQVGVAFLDLDDLYRLRMVEQICHIEHYRRELRITQGRVLNGQEAALEWIEKYARTFPHPDALTDAPASPS